jgi:hypothetical protein
MEYLIGFLLALLSFFILNKLVSNTVSKNPIEAPQFSQSYIHALLGQYVIDIVKPKHQPERQSTERLKKNSIRAFFWQDDVYWIEDGFLVTAKLKENQIDEKTKKRVDTHSLDKVELDKMIFIVDKLTEGNENDSRNSGK